MSDLSPIQGNPGQITSIYDGLTRTGALLHGNRQDWSAQLGLIQVMNKDALLTLNMSYTRSTGYQANPYKMVYVLSTMLEPDQDLSQPYEVRAHGLLETRPDERNQLSWNAGLKHYIEPFDATEFDPDDVDAIDYTNKTINVPYPVTGRWICRAITAVAMSTSGWD